ncbi:MAG: fold [Ignavibacteria bacterium]|nr:fold [Ignavibacteria bacterium]
MVEDAKLLGKLKELESKINEQTEELSDLLRYFELAIIDTREDMRIMNSYGATEEIFAPASKMFERGANLVKVVYKTTKNTKETIREEKKVDEEGNEITVTETEEQEPQEEQEDLEDTINKFVRTGRDEKMMEIVGEKDNGEIFKMVWNIQKRKSIYRSYFKIIPTNTLVKSAQVQHAKEIEIMKNNIKLAFSNVNDGITIIDPRMNIIYMNDSAKRIYIAQKSNFMKNIDVEGKHFKEIFVTEDPDEVKKMIDYNIIVTITKAPQKYNKKFYDHDVDIEVMPLFDEKEECNGILMISKLIGVQNSMVGGGDSKIPVDNKKLIATMKSLMAEKQTLTEKLVELEKNYLAISKNSKESSDSSKKLSTYIENLPVPICVLELPNQKLEYVNEAFQEKYQITKDIILGRVEQELYPPDVAEVLEEKNKEVINNKNIVSFKFNEEIDFRQVAVFGENDEPLQIVRMYMS